MTLTWLQHGQSHTANIFHSPSSFSFREAFLLNPWNKIWPRHCDVVIAVSSMCQSGWMLCRGRFCCCRSLHIEEIRSGWSFALLHHRSVWVAMLWWLDLRAVLWWALARPGVGCQIAVVAPTRWRWPVWWMCFGSDGDLWRGTYGRLPLVNFWVLRCCHMSRSS